jgi:hypothetical protein
VLNLSAETSCVLLRTESERLYEDLPPFFCLKCAVGGGISECPHSTALELYQKSTAYEALASRFKTKDSSVDFDPSRRLSYASRYGKTLKGGACHEIPLPGLC